MDGKESVLAKFDSHSAKLPHWKIYYGYDTNKGNLADSTETHIGDLDVKLSRTKLVYALDNLPPDDYCIQFKTAPTNNNNIIYHRFKIGYAINYNQQQQGNQPLPPHMRGYVSPEQVELRISNELLKRDLEDFKKEMRELKATKVTAWKDIMDGAKELLPVIKGMLQGGGTEARPVRVLGPALNTEEQQAAQERRAYFLKLSNEATSGLYNPEDFGEMTPGEYGIVLLWCINEYKKANPQVYADLLRPELLKVAEKLEGGA